VKHVSKKIPLSFGQEQLWFLEDLSEGSPTYNIPVLYHLRGRLDVSALRRAFGHVVSRHEMLRTTFGAVGGTPVQAIAPAVPVTLPVDDLSKLADDAKASAVGRMARTEAATPFDLHTGPLFRLRLARLAADEHVLSVVVHHIVADGWSFAVLYSELADAYRAFVSGESLPAPPPPANYADFVKWQRCLPLEPDLAYWEKQLSGLPVLDLPSDRPRPPLAGHKGQTVRTEFSQALLADLRARAQAEGVSLFTIAAAALGVVLARYSGQEDIAIGTTMPGRTQPEFEAIIGFFVNMVVLRIDLSGDPSLRDMFERIHKVTLEALDHQNAPFQHIVERLNIARDPSRNPLFQVSMQVLGAGTGASELALPGISACPVPCDSGRSRFDAAFSFSESTDRLSLSLEYSAELFDGWRMEQLIRNVKHVLEAAAADPSARLSDLAVLPDADRAWLLDAGTGTPGVPRRGTLHGIVNEIAAAAPDSVAATFGGRSLTYGELSRRSERLARHLRSLGTRHEDIIAVALPRGPDVLVAFLGILKAGAAFVFLDTAHPVSRLEFILRDTGASIVLTCSDLLAAIPAAAGRRLVCLDREEPDTRRPVPASAEPMPEWAAGASLAYVVYTSGSTGKPKGVLVQHGAVVMAVTTFSERFGFGHDARVLQGASLTFDMSEMEIFAALTSGATLVLAGPETLASPEALADLLRRERVTFMVTSPALLSTLDPEPYPDLRHIVVGGEASTAELINRWNLPGRSLVNGYGPTEAAICCALHECEKVTWQTTPPFGGPMPYRRFYVMDRWGDLAPVGVPGELLIGGNEGLARGYLNQPSLTEERFVADPFDPGGRVYRSGDLVRWTPEGCVEFVGRVDSQVKLRGLRIELEEIEAALAAHPQVAQAAVALREDPGGEKFLAGYVTAAETGAPTAADLRTHLLTQLPAYMVPATLTILDTMPLSAAGKIKRDALPVPEITNAARREFVDVSGPAQERVAAAFAEVLGRPVDQIGADDDFFELGGSSLQAMRVISRVNRAFTITMSVRALYGASTVRDIAAQATTLARAPVDPSAEIERGAVVVRPPRRPADQGESLSPPAQRIIEIFRDVLPDAPGKIRMHDNLFGLGGDESAAAQVLEQIERRLGLSLTTRSLYTVGVLAAAVDAEQITTAAPVFCVPAVSGSGHTYLGLGRLLQSVRPLVVLTAPGLDDDSVPIANVPDLAAAYVAAVREHQPRGPYHLLGWSMGGLVAFEMTRQLVEAGAQVAFLALVDSVIPDGTIPTEAQISEYLARDNACSPDDDHDPIRRRHSVFRASALAAATHRVNWAFPGRLTLVRAAESVSSMAEWTGLAHEIADHTVPGDHYSMWDAASLPTLAAVLADCLADSG
jgi:amino acid adenylation domain-containing protein